MKRWFELSVSAIMGFSALMKLLDFENTVIYFQSLSGFDFDTVTGGVALLIFIEMLIAFTLPINWRGQRRVQDATLLILMLFLGLFPRLACCCACG
ncbi:MAG: hypothetical protein ACE5IR_10765 [bacterium]